jgi:hypothetical protein
MTPQDRAKEFCGSQPNALHVAVAHMISLAQNDAFEIAANDVQAVAPHLAFAIRLNKLQLVAVNEATPERLARTTDSTITEDGARQFQDDLLVRLASKGQLYPDAEINQALLLAGTKYHEDWYGGNMGGLQAIDYGKVSGGQGGSGSSMPPSRISAQHRANYRDARAILGSKYRKAVEPIVLEGQSDLVGIGKAISGAASPHTARSVAIERLTAGLYLLARHYGFVR